MSLRNYINEPGNADYASDEYLMLLLNHRDIIIKDISPTILSDQDMTFYRHRLHAFLLSKHISYCYHLPIMVLNNLRSEFDFGIAIDGILDNNVTTIYIPLIETLNNYLKKIQYKSE